MSELMFEGLIGLLQEVWYANYNLSNQHLQLIHKHILGLVGLLRPAVKIPYQGTDTLTRLTCKAEMIYQSLKGLFAFGVKPR